MKVSELIDKLSRLPQDGEIMLKLSCDVLIDVTLGPTRHMINKNDVQNSGDCECKGIGTVVHVIG